VAEAQCISRGTNREVSPKEPDQFIWLVIIRGFQNVGTFRGRLCGTNPKGSFHAKPNEGLFNM